jgi:hypothetical protein
VFKVLLKRLTKSLARFLLRGYAFSGSIQDRLSFARDRNFRKRVCFNVANKQDLVLLQLQEGGLESFNISSSLFLVN